MADISIQLASEAAELPTDEQLLTWCNAALVEASHDASLALRIVDDAEITALNAQYRGKDKPTNVLSFPADLPPELELDELGDIVICASVVAEEAVQQGKPSLAHWAHMVVHGTLHLQGYDHIDDDEAEVMESLETQIITGLGFAAPYAEEDQDA